MKASRLAPAGGVTEIKSPLDQISNPTRAMKVLSGLYACKQHQRQTVRKGTSTLLILRLKMYVNMSQQSNRLEIFP